jgi:hypothetical protein
MQSENRAVGFVMTVFQKLLDSSSRALHSALRNRRDHLASILAKPDSEMARLFSLEKTLEPEQADPDDMDEPCGSLLSQTLNRTRKDLAIEIATLEGLIALAEAIPANKKGEKLREMMRVLLKKGKKVLIFTQFRTTQDYLAEVLSGFRVELFHGSMSRDQKEEAIQNFREKAEVLISTEAGGEGRNLQFCHILINYDLPWSPLKIEQRIGRIHRFGQAKDVQIYNFSTAGTVAEKVLKVLERKLKLFEESIGTPDILLGQIEEELNLGSVFMEMLLGLKSPRKIGAEIDEKLEKARRSYEKLADLTVTRKMDFNYDEYYRVTLQERKFSNMRIEDFINQLRREDHSVDDIIGRRSHITRLYPLGGRGSRRHGTFSSARALENENLEFLAFGNPLVNSLVRRCREKDFGGLTGIKTIEHDRLLTGMIFHYLVRLRAASEIQELVPVVVIRSNGVSVDEIHALEARALQGAPAARVNPADYRPDIHRISERADYYFAEAGERILQKAGDMKSRVAGNIARPVESELGKIRDSYAKKLKELEEQLERQECQMKWFDKDMKSAMTRTKNRIAEVKREHAVAMDKYRGYLDVSATITLINAGILITHP